MTQTLSFNLKKLGIISAITASLLISAPTKADHDRDYLLLAAPFLLYNLLQDHSYTRHTRIKRHHRGHHKHHQRHYKPRKHSHSRGHYSGDRRHGRRH